MRVLLWMPYPARPIAFDPRDYASHKSLLRVAAFTKGASVLSRQTAIDYVVTAHGFSKDHTRTLVYDSSLDLPGRNIRGEIHIGPQAFEQDLAWLSGIVFHELVHSPQYEYYASKGVTQIDPARSDTERLMIALDEHEAYWWSWKRRVELGLSEQQQIEIRRRTQFALIDVDSKPVNDLARQQKFDGARDLLIQSYKNASGRPGAARNRRVVRTCCN